MDKPKKSKLSISINDDLIDCPLKNESLQINRSTDDSTASFTVVLPNNNDTTKYFDYFYDVKIFQKIGTTNTLLFGGVIADIKYNYVSKDVVYAEIQCGTYAMLLNGITVKNYPYSDSLKTVGSVINSLITNYFSQYGIKKGTINAGVSMDTIDTSDWAPTNASDLMDDLADYSRSKGTYRWYIDFKKRLHYIKQSPDDITVHSTPVVTKSSPSFTNFDYKVDFDDYRNKQYVIGGYPEKDVTDANLTDDGRLFLVVSNTTEIGKMKKKMGGDGVYSNIYENNNLTTVTDVEAVANDLLNQYSHAPNVLSFVSYDVIKWNEGDKVTINIPEVTGTTSNVLFYIDEVNIEDIGGYLLYTYKTSEYDNSWHKSNFKAYFKYKNTKLNVDKKIKKVKKELEKEIEDKLGGKKEKTTVKSGDGLDITVPGTLNNDGTFTYDDSYNRHKNLMKDYLLAQPVKTGAYPSTNDVPVSKATTDMIYRRQVDIDGATKNVLSMEGYVASGSTATNYVTKLFSPPNSAIYNIDAWHLVTFRARSVVGNAYLNVTLPSIDFVKADGVTSAGSSNQIKITNYNQDYGNTFQELDDGWKTYTCIIAPPYAALDNTLNTVNTGFKNGKYSNALQFSNTNLQDYRLALSANDYSMADLQGAKSKASSVDNYFRMSLGFYLKPPTATQTTNYVGKPFAIQVADLKVEELITDDFGDTGGLATIDSNYGDGNTYLGIPSGTSEFRIVEKDESGTVDINNINYATARAASFINNSNVLDKQNVTPINDVLNVKDMVNSQKIYQYHLTTDINKGDWDKRKYGMLAQLADPVFRDDNGVDLYNMVSILFANNQLLNEDIAKLQTDNLVLHQLVDDLLANQVVLQQQITNIPTIT